MRSHDACNWITQVKLSYLIDRYLTKDSSMRLVSCARDGSSNAAIQHEDISFHNMAVTSVDVVCLVNFANSS